MVNNTCIEIICISSLYIAHIWIPDSRSASPIDQQYTRAQYRVSKYSLPTSIKTSIYLQFMKTTRIAQ